MKKKKLLFICIGNSVRSQMAEAIARKLGGDLFDVFSAGLRPAGIHHLTEEVLDEDDITLTGQFSKRLADYSTQEFDVVIPLDEVAGASLPDFPGNPRIINWYMDDPIRVLGSDDMKLRAFRFTRDLLKRRIADFVQKERQSAA